MTRLFTGQVRVSELTGSAFKHPLVRIVAAKLYPPISEHLVSHLSRRRVRWPTATNLQPQDPIADLLAHHCPRSGRNAHRALLRAIHDVAQQFDF